MHIPAFPLQSGASGEKRTRSYSRSWLCPWFLLPTLRVGRLLFSASCSFGGFLFHVEFTLKWNSLYLPLIIWYVRVRDLVQPTRWHYNGAAPATRYFVFETRVAAHAIVFQITRRVKTAHVIFSSNCSEWNVVWFEHLFAQSETLFDLKIFKTASSERTVSSL